MIALIEDILARLFGKPQELPIRVRVDENDKQNPFKGRT